VAGWRWPWLWTAVGASPWWPGRRGWVGQPRSELLFGEAPQPVAEPHATKQLLVPVDPAHRDPKGLSRLFRRQIPAHPAAPATTTRRARARAGLAGSAGDRTVVQSSRSAASSLATPGASSCSSRPASSMAWRLATPEQSGVGSVAGRRRPGSRTPASPNEPRPRWRRACRASSTSTARCTLTLVAGWNTMARRSKSPTVSARRPTVRPSRAIGCGPPTRRRNVVNVFYKHSRIKQYLKDGRAMRIETVINAPRDLGCNARLPNLDELQAKARACNRRILDAERVGQGCVLASPAFERIAHPHRGHGRAEPGDQRNAKGTLGYVSGRNIAIVVARGRTVKWSAGGWHVRWR
jgi:hypothetical protein